MPRFSRRLHRARRFQDIFLRLFASHLFLINTIFDDANERSHAARRKGMFERRAKKQNRLMTCFGIHFGIEKGGARRSRTRSQLGVRVKW